MEWKDISWFQQAWVWEAGGWLLGAALFAAIVWFIDGYRKYGYWSHKEETEENDGDLH